MLKLLKKHKKTKDSKTLNIQIELNYEKYDIQYRKETDPIMLNVYLIKIIEDKDIMRIAKDNELDIKNLTRLQEYKRQMKMFWENL